MPAIGGGALQNLMGGGGGLESIHGGHGGEASKKRENILLISVL